MVSIINSIGAGSPSQVLEVHALSEFIGFLVFRDMLPDLANHVR
jgi:hypothetical protein